MPHYDVSKHLLTIANIWERWTGDLADNRTMLDGNGDTAAALYVAAGRLARAMQDIALPDAVDLDEVIYKTPDGLYAHPILESMADLQADHGREELWFPVGDFCERYGFVARTVQIEDDSGPIAEHCSALLDNGLCDETQVAHVWHPHREPGEMLVLKQIGEEGLYAVFVRERAAEPEAA